MTQAPTEGEARPPSLDSVAAVGAVATLLVYVAVGGLAQVSNLAFGLWFCGLGVFFGVPWLVLRLFGLDAFRAAGMSRPWWEGALFGALVGVVNYFGFVIPMQVLVQKVAPPEWVDAFDVSGIFNQTTPLELMGVVTGVSVAAPLGEEFFFRGLLQRGLEKRMEAARAVVITGFVFSFFHMDPIGFLARWELGIVFGLLAWRSGSIWPGIFAHFGNNAVSTALYFASRDSSSADDNLPGWAPLLMIGVGVPLLWGLTVLANRWPQALTAPWRSEELSRPGNRKRLIAGWVLVAAASFGALFALDPNGVGLNQFDSFHPLKHPKKADSPESRQQLEALWQLRAEARHDRSKIEAYKTARTQAIARRAERDGGAGPSDAGR